MKVGIAQRKEPIRGLEGRRLEWSGGPAPEAVVSHAQRKQPIRLRGGRALVQTGRSEMVRKGRIPHTDIIVVRHV